MGKVTDISGIGEMVAAVLAEHGFHTIEDLAKAKIADLVQVPGFREVKAASVVAAARELNGPVAETSGKPEKAKKATTNKSKKKKEKKQDKKADKSSKKKKADKKAKKSKKKKK